MPDPPILPSSNFVLAAGGVPRLIPSTADKRFQLSAQDGATLDARHPGRAGGLAQQSHRHLDRARRAWPSCWPRCAPATASPSSTRFTWGCPMKASRASALTLDDDVIVINSFKYFHMTGWRLGWMIVPDNMLEAVEKIASSLAICAPTLAPARRAGLLHRRRAQDLRAPPRSLRSAATTCCPNSSVRGLRVPVKPDGALYLRRHQRPGHGQHRRNACCWKRASRAGPGLRSGPRRPHHALLLCHRPDRLEAAVDRMGKLLGH